MSESVVTLRLALSQLKQKASEDRKCYELAVKHANAIKARHDLTMSKIHDMEAALAMLVEVKS